MVVSISNEQFYASVKHLANASVVIVSLSQHRIEIPVAAFAKGYY